MLFVATKNHQIIYPIKYIVLSRYGRGELNSPYFYTGEFPIYETGYFPLYKTGVFTCQLNEKIFVANG